MENRTFYQNLSPFSEFSDAFKNDYYQKVPDDWWVIVADIIGSTKAIEAGDYKKVNFVGSLPIIAAINLLNPLQFPYVFGGDGATLLVANVDKQAVLDVLKATAKIADSRYNLHYRIGAISIKTIRQQGCEVKVAKFKVSNNYQQAFFIGGGLSLADTLIKHDERFQEDISQLTSIDADFSGLECRWQDLPSHQGRVISLLIEVINKADTNNQQSYQHILSNLETLVGNKKQRAVVTQKNLKISLSIKQLMAEAMAFSANEKIGKQLLKIITENLLGKFLIKFAIRQWQFYKENVIKTTDSEKFDDTLRMVIALTELQQKQLIDYLECQYQAKKLIYGIHASNRALMTCLIFERHGQQVHFIDAADGGYALAAKAFKHRKSLLEI